MTGNYMAMYIHLIWTTKHREPLLTKDIRYPLLEHMREEAARKSIQLCIINGVEDHIHGLVALRSTQTVADVVKAIKGEASYWLNQQRLIDGLFTWQDGYGAITVSPPDVPRVTRYIFNQEQHHAHRSLDDELNRFAFHAADVDTPSVNGRFKPPADVTKNA